MYTYNPPVLSQERELSEEEKNRLKILQAIRKLRRNGYVVNEKTKTIKISSEAPGIGLLAALDCLINHGKFQKGE